MNPDSKLANKIASGDFIVTAEYMPQATTNDSVIKDCASFLKRGPTAVNVMDNHYGVAMSSISASVALSKYGVEPVCQIVTRDRNRIALQSDLIGAAYLGINSILCLSGYHQTLIGCSESVNVYDIDPIQLAVTIKNMNEGGLLLDGTKIDGEFCMLVGTNTNPYLRPLEMNVIQLQKMVNAGVSFIQTQAVFDIDAFKQWFDAARSEGITDKIAILAGVMPLVNADEAKKLHNTYTDINIPDSVIERISISDDQEVQKRASLTICNEIIEGLRNLQGLRGIHIISRGNEAVVPEIINTAGL